MRPNVIDSGQVSSKKVSQPSRLQPRNQAKLRQQWQGLRSSLKPCKAKRALDRQFWVQLESVAPPRSSLDWPKGARSQVPQRKLARWEPSAASSATGEKTSFVRCRQRGHIRQVSVLEWSPCVREIRISAILHCYCLPSYFPQKCAKSTEQDN